MATTQLSDVKSKITYWVDDLQKGYFTDTQLNAFVNSAQFETQKLLIQSGHNWYVTVADTQMVQGQKEYILPTDFLCLHRLEMITQGYATPNEVTNVINQITINQQDVFPFSQGQPQGYFLKKNSIILVPPPDSNYYLRAYYSYRAAKLVLDTDIVDVPDEYAEMVSLFAAMDCFVKDDRNPAQIVAKLDDYRERLKKAAEDRQIDASRSVVVTSDGGFGVLF